VAPELPAVPMDPALIAQVLINLLDNAVKYSPPEESVAITAQVTDGGQLRISVTDHGSGIPPEDLERVFDKFYRVHRPEEVSGTGLGLSICKGIVEAHGGRIWAENLAGGGLRASFTLPLGTASLRPSPEDEGEDRASHGSDDRAPADGQARVGRNVDVG
jgi:two-component system, OmpR family, sensor histidine kinase KdpD